MLPDQAPQGRDVIEAFLLDELPSMGPPPRGAEGLARARRLFSRLGDPQDFARPIHIVGTAGKGTAAGAIIGRLVGAGASVGAHLSPHVYDLRERFLLNGALPEWDHVDAALTEMWPGLVSTEAVEGRPPSFFELTTALSWVIGRIAGVDVQVTEAGIGGEFDATNAINRSDKITVITPIGYDHLEILGDDLIDIAQNKAAVIQPGGRVIVAPQPHSSAAHVIQTLAEARHAHTHWIETTPTEGAAWVSQAVAIADLALRLLQQDVPDLHANTRAVPVHLPGRLEQVEIGGRMFILDGAHNPLKLRGLREGLSGDRVTVLVAALSHEKVLDSCAAELAQLADTIIATDFVVAAGDRVVRRSWSARQLADAISAARPEATVLTVSGIENAIAKAVAMSPRDGTIVTTGSFMMLEPARNAALATLSDL